MVEERIAVGRCAKLGHWLKKLRVVAVDLRHVLDEFRLVLVMRQRMVRLRHANLWIRTALCSLPIMNV